MVWVSSGRTVQEEVTEELLESLRVVVSFASGLALQRYRRGIHRWHAVAAAGRRAKPRRLSRGNGQGVTSRTA